MPFSGPGRNYGSGVIQGYDLYRQKEQTDFDRAMESARLGASVSAQFAQNVQAENERRARAESEQRQAVTTPGVREGISGGSDSMYSVADSPMMRSDARRFTAGGKDYTYSPMAAGREQGRAQAEGQTVADQTRFEALRKIPGIGEKGAARMVYGRAYDEADKSEQNRLLAEYISAPSREKVAEYVRAGGTPTIFPEQLFYSPTEGELTPRARPPVEGTPEWWKIQEGVQDLAIGKSEAIKAKDREIAMSREQRILTEQARDNAARAATAHMTLQAKMPRPQDYRDPQTGQQDMQAYQAALANWRNSVMESQTIMQGLNERLMDTESSAAYPIDPLRPPPTAYERSEFERLRPPPPLGENDYAIDAQQQIAKIQASALPSAEKARRVQLINQRLREALRGLRGPDEPSNPWTPRRPKQYGVPDPNAL